MANAIVRPFRPRQPFHRPVRPFATVVVRRVRLRSVAAFAVVFLAAMTALALLAGALAWYAADRLGVVPQVEQFIVELGFDDFRFEPGRILVAALLVGAVVVVAATLVALVVAAGFNLATRATGGIELTLVERGTALTRRNGDDGAGPAAVAAGNGRGRAGGDGPLHQRGG